LFVLALLLLPLWDTRSTNPLVEYGRVRQLFLHGYLEQSQTASDRDYARALSTDPIWASQFQLLEADSMVWRGLYGPALKILGSGAGAPLNADEKIERASLEGIASTRLQQFSAADHSLAEAQALCDTAVEPGCGGVLRARGILATERGRFSDARSLFIQSRDFARSTGDEWLETTALLNLGFISLQTDDNDAALEWSRQAYRDAREMQADDLAERASGNLGWAYFKLGDRERALQVFTETEKEAAGFGNVKEELKWLTAAGYVGQEIGDFGHAAESYSRALGLARQISSKEDIINSLEDLAHVCIQEGKLDEADGYLRQVDPLIRVNGNRLDALDVMLARGRIAAARRQDGVAEGLFRQVKGDPASQITMRLGAEHELARLYEAEGRPADAEKEYGTALGTFESARADIRNEASKLPYFANATPIYDDSIRLLVSEGKSEEALAEADQSRARTLEQGLGLEGGKASLKDAAFRPESIAARAGATLLFYWLGEKQSWLWAITPRKTAVFALPARREIARTVERYRQELLGPEDPLAARNEDGRALYRMLVAPAKDLIAPDSKVVVLCDGALSELNFETLLVDAANAQNGPHYWIEDADVVSAPSLLMLGASKPAQGAGGRLLLVGDAVSPGPEYPELPNAGLEMREIEKHFGPQEATVFAGERANAEAYLESEPQRFSYIDFVAHGVASRTDPLDSAIILSRMSDLSRAPGADDSFKLYAREIMEHPIDARLVTIAACYGGGTRSYAGEGLVGLSWAFLRAGAHNVIGALWEVSDESTPRLMDALYEGLQEGLPPGAALRAAKLKLLHGDGAFRRPFYWGSFQLYTAGYRG
jgi:CHAT domain-containing protein/tetratricopeptide (TPR) repeat protein